MAWVRSGECNRCGECCRSGDPFLGREGDPEVEGACVLLTRAQEGFACRSWGEGYHLQGCNVWPSQPSHIEDYPSCSYSFTLVSDGG